MSRIIKVWESRDGKFFRKKAEADKYDKELVVNQRLKELVRTFYFSNISEESVVEELIESKKELKKILLGG